MGFENEIELALARNESRRTVYDQLGRLRQYLVNIVLAFVILIAVIVTLRTFNDDSISIEPVAMPTEFVTSGYSPETVSARVIFGIEQYQAFQKERRGAARYRDIGTSRHLASQSQGEIPSFSFSGASLSIDGIVKLLRAAFNVHQPTIHGSVTCRTSPCGNDLDGVFELVDISPKIDSNRTIKISAASIDELISMASTQITQSVDPMSYGSYAYAKSYEVQGSPEETADLDMAEQMGFRALLTDNLWARNLLAAVSSRRNDFGDAKRWASLAISENQRFAPAYNTRASNDMRLVKRLGIGHRASSKLIESAKTDYLTAISFEPRFAAAYFNLSRLYHFTGNHVAEIQVLQKGHGEDPDYARLSTRLGQIYNNQGRYQEAELTLSTVLSRERLPLGKDTLSPIRELHAAGPTKSLSDADCEYRIARQQLQSPIPVRVLANIDPTKFAIPSDCSAYANRRVVDGVL